MQRITSLLLLGCTGLFFPCKAQISSFIHVDQFGYLTNAEKVAVISNPQSGFNATDSYQAGINLEVLDFQTNTMVYSAAPSVWSNGSTHAQSGDQGWWFDFSPVNTPGTYVIRDPSSGEQSAPFEINANPYREVLSAALRMYYYNRCNFEKTAPFAAASWTDSDNFSQDAQCRYIYDPGNASLEKDLRGGWFDAGDYNKYVTFAYQPIHNLLWTYEEHPELFGDDWNWPESGNGIPDLLDEIKWELDWLLRMSNSDGTVHIKMGSQNYSENTSAPPSTNNDMRFYGPTCTAASAAVASIFAHASAVFSQFPSTQAYSQALEDRAIACWDYWIDQYNNNQLETACDDGSIVAGDADWTEILQLEAAATAAVHFWANTGQQTFHDFFLSTYGQFEPISAPFWGPYKNYLNEALLWYTTLPGADATASQNIRQAAITDVNNDGSGYFQFNASDLYRTQVPDWMFHWGSNQPLANTANLIHIMLKYEVVPGLETTLRKKAAEQLHYFHGVNPLGMLHLSNMYAWGGDRCVNEIYHTWFYDGTDWDHALQSTYGPAPGFLTGGANKDFTIGSISPPSNQPPMKSYLDFNTGWPDNSWEISEPSISYQAAYIRLLAHYVNNNATTATFHLKLDPDCVSIYPNPTGNAFHIRGQLGRYNIGIYQANGQLYQQITDQGSDSIIDISNLPAGTFFIRVENHNNQLLCVQKILKQ